MRILGQATPVRKSLTYKEKIDTAKEFVERHVVCDEEAGVCYEGHLKNAVMRLMQIKAYTDYDIDGLENEEGLCHLMDLWQLHESDMDEFEEVIAKDWYGENGVDELADQIFMNVKAVFEAKNSLAYKIGTSFAFLFNNKDLSASLAEANGVNEQMIKFMETLKNTSAEAQKPIDLSAYARKEQKG